ncbi:N-acetylglucosamine-6-phosphate deacetylase [Agromyces atrinae]|uniref:N-acetylglucosamine-6-phosphate deacetylase n=1 Tax=Agromyces atrinae TaxID=592376 RepID=UPI001F5979FD|nr:N-acetylglucosamine-6-phosphate deacetylase [Agromyces atrinae]MCI2957919.1 N-acetylglucosamine-6-phosphate deacetylase [Agromyces atrinae]
MPPSTIIHSARIVSNGSVTDDGWVRFDGDRISARGVGRSWEARPGDEVVDAGGRHLTPGFVDIHVHGGGGAAFDDGPEAIARALAMHRRHGTTRAVISLVTAPVEALERRVAEIAALTRRDHAVLGSHLEGPFLADSHRGAHDPALLRSPDQATIERLLEAADGTLTQVTLAPELPGALDATRSLVAAGSRVAVGHTGASADEARAAFDVGATILTHAFNGMRGIHHRAPGPVTAALSTDGITLEIIDDGVHVHADVVNLAFTAAPGRIALVSDAMAAAGAADGLYDLGSLRVSVTDGVARLVDGGAIAGSTLTLGVAVRNAIAHGMPLATAVAAASIVPARAIGRGDDLGALEVGYAADAVLLDDDLEAVRVWSAGDSVFAV